MRKARNQLELDLLPPFGVPEVSLSGDIAVVAGLIISGAIAISILMGCKEHNEGYI